MQSNAELMASQESESAPWSGMAGDLGPGVPSWRQGQITDGFYDDGNALLLQPLLDLRSQVAGDDGAPDGDGALK